MDLQAICGYMPDVCQISTDISEALRTAHIISMGNLTPLAGVLTTGIPLLVCEITKEWLQKFMAATPVRFVAMIFLTFVFYPPGDIYLGLALQYALALIWAFMEQVPNDSLFPFALICLIGVLGFVVIQDIAGQNVPDIAIFFLTILLVFIVLTMLVTYPFAFPLTLIAITIMFLVNEESALQIVADIFAKLFGR